MEQPKYSEVVDFVEALEPAWAAMLAREHPDAMAHISASAGEWASLGVVFEYALSGGAFEYAAAGECFGVRYPSGSLASSELFVELPPREVAGFAAAMEACAPWVRERWENREAERMVREL